MPRAFVLGASFLIYHRKLYPLVLAGVHGVIYYIVLASAKDRLVYANIPTALSQLKSTQLSSSA